MIVRSNIITSGDVYDAADRARVVNHADIYIEDIRDFKPRREAHGVEFYAYSHGGTAASAHRPVGSYPLDEVQRAASWSDYGYLIAHLFNKDPHAQIGRYKHEADFVENIREYPRRARNGTPLPADFLNVLTSFAEYGALDLHKDCPVCGSSAGTECGHSASDLNGCMAAAGSRP